MVKSQVALLSGLAVLALQPAARAWNGTGHRIVAYIAYKELDAETIGRVVAVLEKHPAAGTALWTQGGVNGTDRSLNLFLNAATFPDDVRHSFGPNRFHDATFNKYHKEPNHFVDFQFRPPATAPCAPAAVNTILNTYQANLALVKDASTNDADRAVALSWIIHQIGDVHQPLHCASRFAGKLTCATRGDEGGNGVEPFPNPRGHHDLHSFWDDLLGSDSSANSAAKLQKVAEGVRQAVPSSTFTTADLKGADDLKPWALDSFQQAVEKAYGPLPTDLDMGDTDPPGSYDTAARTLAQQRIALAGYRLASELKALFAR